MILYQVNHLVQNICGNLQIKRLFMRNQTGKSQNYSEILSAPHADMIKVSELAKANIGIPVSLDVANFLLFSDLLDSPVCV